jgi:hypothetical protein
MALTARALQALQVRLKSVNNEGHSTLKAEKVFRTYFLSHCGGVPEIFNMALIVPAI